MHLLLRLKGYSSRLRMSTARILGFPVLALLAGVLKQAGPLSSHRSMRSSTEIRGDTSAFSSLSFRGSRLWRCKEMSGKTTDFLQQWVVFQKKMCERKWCVGWNVSLYKCWAGKTVKSHQVYSKKTHAYVQFLHPAPWWYWYPSRICTQSDTILHFIKCMAFFSLPCRQKSGLLFMPLSVFTYVISYPSDISTWMNNQHLKLNLSRLSCWRWLLL